MSSFIILEDLAEHADFLRRRLLLLLVLAYKELDVALGLHQ